DARLAFLGALVLRPQPWLSRAGFRRIVVALAVLATMGHGLNEAFDWSRSFRIVQGLRLVALFFTAAALQVYRERIPLHVAGVAAAVIGLVAALLVHGLAMTLYPLSLTGVVLWVALVPDG